MFRWVKRVVKVLVLLAVVVFVGVPLLASTGFVRGKVEASLSASLGQPAKVEGLSFWWFSGASVEGVDLGGGAFRLSGLKADPDLLSLLTGEKRIGLVRIDRPVLRVVRMDDGRIEVPLLTAMRNRPAPPAEGSGEGGGKGPGARLLTDVLVSGLAVEVVDERGAPVGSYVCPEVKASVDTGGGAGPMKATLAAAGLVPSAEFTSSAADGVAAVARLDVDLAALSAAGLLPAGPAKRFTGTARFTMKDRRFRAVLEEGAATHGLSLSPDLGDAVTAAAVVTGDLAEGVIGLEGPAQVRAGTVGTTITGEIRRGADGAWAGGFAADVAGTVPRPNAESTAAGRAEGRIAFTMGADAFDLTADLRLLDVVLAMPGSPEFREKRVDIRLAAGKPAGGKFALRTAELKGEGVKLEVVEATADGGRLRGGGLLSRIQPFVPSVNLSAAGSFTLDGRFARGADGTEIRGLRLVTDFATIEGDGTFGKAGRLTLRGGGNLARLPKGLLPEKLPVEGMFTVEAMEFTFGGGAFAGSGAIAVRDLALGGGARSPTSRLTFRVGKDPAGMRIEEVRFAADRADLTVRGTMADGAFEGTVAGSADLSFLPPTMMPKGSAASGKVSLDLAMGPGPGTLSAQGASVRLSAPDEPPAEVADLRLSAVPSWTKGAKWPTLANGRLEVYGARFRDYDARSGAVNFSFADGVLTIPTADMQVNGGVMTLRDGFVDLRGAKPVWSLDWRADKVALAAKMEPEMKYLAPFFGSAAGLTGVLNTGGKMADRGDGAGLSGAIDLLVNDGVIRGSPILSAVLTWLRRQTEVSFTEVAGRLSLGGGRIATEGGPLRIVTNDMTIFLEGFTDTKGPLDYHVRVKFPEGSEEQSRWAKALKDGVIPMRLTGTLASPSLAPPALDKLAEGVLDDLFKRGIKDLIPGRK